MKPWIIPLALLIALLPPGATGANIAAPDYQGPCKGVDATGKCQVPIVSLINLIATPERFHQRKVVVVGYASIAFEDVAIGFAKDSTSAESFWLAIDDGELNTNADVDRSQRKFREWRKKYHGRWVRIEGVFDMTMRGHGGMYPGGLRNITQIEPTGRR